MLCGVGISCNLQLQVGQSDGVEDNVKGGPKVFLGQVFWMFFSKTWLVVPFWSLFKAKNNLLHLYIRLLDKPLQVLTVLWSLNNFLNFFTTIFNFLLFFV